ncbi:putative RNA-directed DNA polymerase [Helianthus annuus]|nr:putative RNA-directed DNA polymerase [Helianthus annuus]
MELSRSMIKTKHLSRSYWAEAVACATYLLNRASTKSVPNKTPQEVWSGNKPSIGHLRVFGCVAYAHIPKQYRGKLDDKAEKAIFVGYSEHSKAYKLHNPVTNKIIISRDVVFDENQEWGDNLASNDHTHIQLDDSCNNGISPEVNASQEITASEIVNQVNDINSNGEIEGEQSSQTENMQNSEETNEQISNQNETDSSSSSSENEELRTRDIREIYQNSHPLTEAQVNDLYNRNQRENISDAVDFMLYADADPISYDDAFKDKKWRDAMDREIQSIQKNGTWELVNPPKNQKPIGVKWIYKTKYDEHGRVSNYKARLVAKGYSQKYGVDYQEVFAPVIRFDTIRIVLALAASHGWQLHQMDVKTAFLNGKLTEQVYLEEPTGYVKKGEEQKVCYLKKALYGLKQAPRAWYSRIDGYFTANGFKKSVYEHTLFIKVTDNTRIIVCLYVDDLILASDSIEMIEQLKRSMKSEFEMTDLGVLHYFLGLEVNYDNGNISLTQKKYAKRAY